MMDSNYKIEDLMKIVKEMDGEKLADLASKNKSKKIPFCFKDILKDLTKNERDELWDHLHAMVSKCSVVLLESTSDQSAPPPSKKAYIELNQVLTAIIDMAFVVLDHDMAISQGLLHMVLYLNGVIFEIPSNMENLKNNIAHLSEKIYHSNYINENHYFNYNTFLYIIMRSLTRKATKTDVKRVYSMRSMIHKIIGKKEVGENQMWELLKKCVVSSLYLSMPEGQKIIAMTFTVDPEHIAEIHGIIKAHLPSCSLRQGTSYGKVYFEAWSHYMKINSEKEKRNIELTCIQDIILLSVNGRSRSLVLVMHKLLAQFHCQRKDIQVSKMLYLLYQPILWLHLKNPDGVIRANTAQLFLDVFPLEDPDVKVVTTDIELNDQMLMIRDLLLDDYPIVRTTTVIGVCLAMSINWELFPEEMLRTYFKIMVNDLSCDSSSSDVRCAVAKGFKVLLENPLTLPTLQGVLPKLKGLFHDISDNVRIAFCQLLLRIKKISAIKYYDIVPLDHLLARMEEDCHAVSKSIANLIHNSYFPKNEGPEIWLARCLQMIKADRGASRVFFNYVPGFIGLESSAKFMIQAVKAIHFYVKSKVTTKKICVLANRCNIDNFSNLSESVSTLEEAAAFHDPNIVSGLIDAVTIMWLTTLPDLETPEKKNLLKMVVAKLSRCLGDLSLYYKETPAWESVYYLTSYMPSSNVPGLASLCFLRLKSMDPHALPKDYMTLLECLCNQNESFNLLEMLKEWITAGCSEYQEKPSGKKRKVKGKKSADIKEDFPPKPLLAVQMLNSLLDHRSCQRVLLSRHPDLLKDFLNFVDVLKKFVELAHKNTIPLEKATFITDLFFALLKIAVLIDGEDTFNALKFVDALLFWIEESLLNRMTSKELNASFKKTKKRPNAALTTSFDELVSAISKDICVVTIDMTTLGLFNEKTGSFLKFGLKIISTDSGFKYLLPVSKLLCKHISYAIYCSAKEDEVVDMMRFVPDCFNKIIQCVNAESFFQNIAASDLKEVQFLIPGVLHLLRNQRYSALNEMPFDLCLSTVKCILNSISSALNNVEEEYIHFKDVSIPNGCNFLLTSIVSRLKAVGRFFLHCLYKYVIKSVNDIYSWISCCVILFNVLEIKSLSKHMLKEIGALTKVVNQKLCILYPRKKLKVMNTLVLPNATDEVVKDRDATGDTNKVVENSKATGDEELEKRDVTGDTNEVVENLYETGENCDSKKSFENHCYLELEKLRDLLQQKKL